MQLPLLQPDSPWKAPRLGDLPSWAGAKRVAVDVETCDPLVKKLGPGVRRGAYIVGYSFAIEDGPSFYIPLRHAGGDNIPNPEAGLQYLRDQAKVFTGDLCGANMQYDLDFMAEAGINWDKVHRFRDCQIAEPLLDELQYSYSLDNIAKRRGLPGKNEELLREAAKAWHVDPKAELWKLPARFVGAYAEQDVKLPLQLLRRQERELEDEELWDVWELESKLLPVLVRMRRRGVRVDWKKLEAVEAWSLEEEKLCLDRVHAETGVRIGVGDVWQAAALEKALIKIGVTVPRTPKNNQPSIDKNLLSTIKHPVARALERARKVNKLRTTFAQSVRNHAIGDRIHCTFNQLRKTDDNTDEDKGGRYGRLSCTDPNLQQQPSRDDFAKRWRSIYIPDEGGIWAANDFSQQEPRWLVHFAELCRCIRASIAAEKYRTDPNTDNHTMMARLIYGYKDTEEPDKKHRTNAKIIFLGLCYGMGGAKLARSLGLPTKWKRMRGSGKMVEVAGDEAQLILDQFNRAVPFVKQLAKKCEDKAKCKGYIRTISGRKCRFPRKKDGSFDWSHKALNRLIQGSSADQTKMVMVAADEAGYRLQLQVHDELGQTVYSPEEGHALGELMRNTVKARVPFRVDVEMGPNWGEAA